MSGSTVLTSSSERADGRPAAAAALSVLPRLVPYPYRAMLAICSDLDETPNRRVYREIARFLNTTATTEMGPGVGLEVGNTIYFDMPRSQFAYWNTDDAGRALVRALIGSGHVDCLHSYGDLATTREFAARALEELTRHDLRLEVWIDHATAPSNLGADIMRGRGDVPGSPVYHADLTLQYGVRYVWRGRVTSVIGQDVPRRVAAVFDPRHPAQSLPTVAKELVKGAAARAGSRKYSMHSANRVLQRVTLRDGQQAVEFLRMNPHWGGVSRGETADGIAEVLTDRVLGRLVASGGISILYTHLGKVTRRDQPFSAGARAAWRRLAAYARREDILVTTTRRLLGYCDAVQQVRATLTPGNGVDTLAIDADGARRRDDLQGLTFAVRDPDRTAVWVGGEPLARVQRNPARGTEPASVTIPWTRLEFPSP
jgi:hypothetical protein